MKIIETDIADVKIIEPDVFGDQRGWFLESWHESKFAENVLKVQFKQDNVSSSSKGVLRGLHFQTEQSQGKLIQVLVGEVYDVAVDIRKNSPTYGQWVGVLLSESNRRQMWIPEGFAHGFYVLSEQAICTYKCTDLYHPKSEVCIRWDDPELCIDWPLLGEPIISSKDAKGIDFKALCI
ncbi:dTDP-4-dehydrorhamnose 3,5-epimerase [Shewanella sp. OPT22]|nr:dTDP-4-dehydrorhamnose 3,5-epimerase [Shewanella sp. OPT22]